MKTNKDSVTTVMKLVCGDPLQQAVKLFYQSNLLLLREATNKYKYSICLNKGCRPVLMSLNNKRVGLAICKYLDKLANLTKPEGMANCENIQQAKISVRSALNSINVLYMLNYKNWSSHT